MNKLRLDVEDLSVETFQTGDENAPRQGTVVALAATPKIVCDISTLKTDMTCCPCTPVY